MAPAVYQLDITDDKQFANILSSEIIKNDISLV
jgi:hypothetical protein